MKYLFIFAHPDDETVACAATLHALSSAGEDVLVVSVTDGGGGEVSSQVKATHSEVPVGTIRTEELAQALKLLGVKNYQVLHFTDGQITNHMVWGELRGAIIEVIDSYHPDVVVTFDHSGWYFHLDHVAVSIATTLAVQQAEFPPDVFFFAHFRVNDSKWKYIYTDQLPITHRVDATKFKQSKYAALSAHVSQDLTGPKRQLDSEPKHYELYQLASASEKGKKLLKQHWLFSAQD